MQLSPNLRPFDKVQPSSIHAYKANGMFASKVKDSTSVYANMANGIERRLLHPAGRAATMTPR